MPASPAPAAPGRDDDLAWLDRDPMTATGTRASWTGCASRTRAPRGRVRGPRPLTEEELAEIGDAAADELLGGRGGQHGPSGPGPARLGADVPRRVVQPGGRVRPGMVFDVLPGCAQLAVAANAAAGDDRFAGVSEAELIGIMCGWDRVEAHAAAGKLAVIAELARRNPAPEDAEVHRGPDRERAGASPVPRR